MAKIRMTMLSKARWSINIISMSMYSTNMATKHRKIKILNQDNQSHNQHVKYLKQIYQWSTKKNHCVRISNQDNRPIQSIMSMSQMKTREPSMCNQEVSIHWSIHQTPHLLHFKFKLDPLKDPQWSRHFVDPAFRLMRFPLNGGLDFYWKNWFFIV